MKTKISYEEATRILTSREKFYICLGLDRIAKVLNLMGNPQEKLRIIHIARIRLMVVEYMQQYQEHSKLQMEIIAEQ